MKTVLVKVKDGFNGHTATVTATADGDHIRFTTESGAWYNSGIALNNSFSEKNRVQLSIHTAMKTTHRNVLSFEVTK